MFEDLSLKFDGIFRRLRGQGTLGERHLKQAMKEVRKALLEADVGFKIAKAFCQSIEKRALGSEVLSSIQPGEMVVKIVHDEMVGLLGGRTEDTDLSGQPPVVLMLVGLQGAGKTTAAGKLAQHFSGRGRFPMLVAADVYRPAAIEQLKIVGEQIEVPVFSGDTDDPVVICRDGVAEARRTGRDLVILDTAGRLNIDDEMMAELDHIESSTKPHEILLVADGMTGQVAVDVARDFSERLTLGGVLLTKMDGDARGGAALSICQSTQVPIKFLSVGEKLGDLEPFHPSRMASRILGMGDVVTLVERAQEVFDEDQAAQIERKLRTQTFTLDDFLVQLDQVKKMGPPDQMLGMIPGMGKQIKDMDLDDGAFKPVEAIICSMTPQERHTPRVIDGSRRKRIARGSGTSVQEINRLLKQFDMMRKMMKAPDQGQNKGPGKKGRRGPKPVARLKF